MENGTSVAIKNVMYCNLTDFTNTYKNYHGYLSILVCIFGSVTNVFNICVLTTREMRWPTNLILTGLAVTDLLVMLEYIPFVAHYYLTPKAKLTLNHYSYSWAVFMYFHALFPLICHFISCCLTVILAIWRYVAISQTQNNVLLRTVTSIPRTLLTIFLTYLWCPLICLPLFMTHNIITHSITVDVNGTIISDRHAKSGYTGLRRNVSVYMIDISGNLRGVSFLIYGVVMKLVPCILLTILSFKIIGVLLETKKRRRLLLINSGIPLVTVDVDGRKSITTKHKRNIEKEHQTDRTTRMLLVVLLLFLITEFPQAILALLTVVIGKTFGDQCYHPLGDIMDFLALTNSGINFILYCSMSRQFRLAFRAVFKLKVCDPWMPVPLAQHQATDFNNGGTTQVTFV